LKEKNLRGKNIIGFSKAGHSKKVKKSMRETRDWEKTEKEGKRRVGGRKRKRRGEKEERETRYTREGSDMNVPEAVEKGKL